MDRAGFDVNSLIREYARKIVKADPPLPAGDDMRIMPFDNDLVLTLIDYQKMQSANTVEFRNSKEAN